MRRRIVIFIITALALLLSASCSHAPRPLGTVNLTFYTGEISTKAGDGVITDGGGIFYNGDVPDLRIMIFGGSGSLVAQYPDEGSLSAHTDTTATVQFTNIDKGEYYVYAVANVGDTGDNIAYTVDWANATKSDLDALTFTALTDNNTPNVNSRMPLSAKGTLSVNSNGNGQASLDLLRCFAKVQLSFNNLTGNDEPLAINNCTVTISDMNPTSGYMFKPDGNDNTGSARALTLSSGTTFSIAKDGSHTFGPIVVFPSVPSTHNYYSCDISFTLGDSDNRSFTGLPVHDNKSQNITSLGRNQYLKIETRISNKTEISFNFVVEEWNTKKEEVIFH